MNSNCAFAVMFVATSILVNCSTPTHEDYFTLSPSQGLNFSYLKTLPFSTQASVPTVVLIGDQLFLYYQGKTGLRAATSQDGLSWREVGEVRSSFQDFGVIYLEEGIRFFFSEPVMSVTPSQPMKLSWEDTQDGFNFKKGETCFQAQDFDKNFLGVPHIIAEDGGWRLYYVGDGAGKNNIRIAFSSDKGKTWKAEGILSSSPNEVDPESINLTDGSARLYFNKGAEGDIQRSMWAREASRSSIKAQEVLSTRGAIYDPSILQVNGRVFMFYGAQGSNGMEIRVAESK
jgi:hypothetical protein